MHFKKSCRLCTVCVRQLCHRGIKSSKSVVWRKEQMPYSSLYLYQCSP